MLLAGHPAGSAPGWQHGEQRRGEDRLYIDGFGCNAQSQTLLAASPSGSGWDG
jgi:hypothetical protein